MACDEELAERVRACLIGRKGFSERKMFGGIVFMPADEGISLCRTRGTQVGRGLGDLDHPVRYFCFHVAGEEGEQADVRKIPPSSQEEMRA